MWNDRYVPAVIFDLDGVLIESEPLWREGFRAAVLFLSRELDVTATLPSDDDLKRFEGGRVTDTVRSLAAHYFPDAPVNEKLLERAAAHTIQTATELLRLDPPVIRQNVEVARELGVHDIRLAVASSSPRSFIDAALDVLDLNELFKIRESAFELQHAKPHPEVYLNVLTRLEILPQQAVAIEDSHTGASAALRAGIPTLLVNAHSESGPRDADAFRAEGGRIKFLRRLSVEEINFIAEESTL